ncbi:MAG: SsrA-binding protein, partial [Actinomycetota bacterium]
MTKKKSKRKPASNVVASNPKARHDYELLETMEAGIVLTGSEVKSLRAGSASLRESFAVVRGGEVLLCGMHIAP